MDESIRCRTPNITGSKKQSEERAALFAVRVHVIVSGFILLWLLLELEILPEKQKKLDENKSM